MSRYTRVFRIEHCQSGHGPYLHKGEKDSDLVLERTSSKRTPCLHEDRMKESRYTSHVAQSASDFSEVGLLPSFIKDNGYDFLFGFMSTIQLFRWFTEDEIRSLHANKFNLVVYETTRSNILLFEKQSVILHMSETSLLWKQNLISLLD